MRIAQPAPSRVQPDQDVLHEILADRLRAGQQRRVPHKGRLVLGHVPVEGIRVRARQQLPLPLVVQDTGHVPTCAAGPICCI